MASNRGSERYATIVADPPWSQHSGVTGATFGKRHNLGWGKGEPYVNRLTYPTLTLDEIERLPVADLAAADAFLFLWTTSATLEDAFAVQRSWGFTYICTLAWCKSPKGFMGGTFLSNLEFVLYGRRGNARATGKSGTRWFQWNRVHDWRGKPLHSAKPEAFLDLVEQVSPGPYLELFARRNRLGWDTWGDEALEHAELSAPGEDSYLSARGAVPLADGDPMPEDVIRKLRS